MIDPVQTSNPSVAEMMPWELQPLNGGWRLPLEQRAVSRCSLDYAFILEFYEAKEKATLRIESAFSIRDDKGFHEFIATKPAELGSALALFGQVVRLATVSQEGGLEIAFEDGRILSVEPDDCYEAWEMVAPGMYLVCAPGGRIDVWQDAIVSRPNVP